MAWLRIIKPRHTCRFICRSSLNLLLCKMLHAKHLELLTADIATSRYVAFRDVPRFEALCRQCPNYNCRWGCPPLGATEEFIGRFSLTTLIMIKIQVVRPPTPLSDVVEQMSRLIQQVRRHAEPRILAREKDLRGRAALFTGMCPHCPGKSCARIDDQPCRHPDKVRPSLEALGFDLNRTAVEIFDTPILWASNGYPPPYISLIGALFIP